MGRSSIKEGYLFIYEKFVENLDPRKFVKSIRDTQKDFIQYLKIHSLVISKFLMRFFEFILEKVHYIIYIYYQIYYIKKNESVDDGYNKKRNSEITVSIFTFIFFLFKSFPILRCRVRFLDLRETIA